MPENFKDIKQKMEEVEAAHEAEEHNRAVEILNGIVAAQPDYVPAYRKLGSILTYSRFQKRAEEYLNKAVDLAPEDPQNWETMGYLYSAQKEWARSISAFEKALEYGGKRDNEILSELVRIHRMLGDLRSAKEITDTLLEQDPENLTYRWWYAQLLDDMDQKHQALEAYEDLLDEKKSEYFLAIVERWLELMMEFGHIAEAKEKIEKLMEEKPDTVAYRYFYAKIALEDLNENEALQIAEEAYAMDHDNLPIIHFLIHLYGIFNEREKVEACYKRAIEIAPDQFLSPERIKGKYKTKYGDEIFRHLNKQAVHMAKLPSKGQCDLHYALGKAYDDVGDLATAFEHYRLGGELHAQGRQNLEYRYLDEKLFLLKKLPSDYFCSSLLAGCPSEKPIFILGMPRSGTTLMEQVLSGMSNVYGAGELKYAAEALQGLEINGIPVNNGTAAGDERSTLTYAERGEFYIKAIEALAPKGSRRVVDKMPHNFTNTGFIHLMLPNAAIIHARRHPVETCLSAYRIQFAKGHYWSDDLRTMGQYYRLYTELMAYWQKVLPEGTILNVRYEDMVTNLELESKRIAEHIGVEWSEKCLEFHTRKKAVYTASLSQVRQPLYQSSMNRWRKYEPYLKPLLDEIGDLVEAYEAEL